MNRRSLLKALGVLPLVGWVVSAVAGAEELDISPDALVTQEIELPIYAYAGETVTCESGHPICDFVQTVHVGQMQDPKTQIGNWRQEEPAIGSEPVCVQCGALFTDGIYFHFSDGWRSAKRGDMLDWSKPVSEEFMKLDRSLSEGVSIFTTSHPS